MKSILLFIALAFLSGSPALGQVGSLLWEENSSANPRRNLRKTLWQLQRALDSQFPSGTQEAVLQVGPEWVAELADRVHGDLWPDCTLLLDAPVEVGRGRARLRGPEDRIEREQSAFFQRVRDGYLARAQAEPNRFRIIDATHPLEQVQREIALALDELIAGAES